MCGFVGCHSREREVAFWSSWWAFPSTPGYPRPTTAHPPSSGETFPIKHRQGERRHPHACLMGNKTCPACRPPPNPPAKKTKNKNNKKQQNAKHNNNRIYTRLLAFYKIFKQSCSGIRCSFSTGLKVPIIPFFVFRLPCWAVSLCLPFSMFGHISVPGHKRVSKFTLFHNRVLFR